MGYKIFRILPKFSVLFSCLLVLNFQMQAQKDTKDIQNIKETVQTFFTHFHKGDTTSLKKLMDDHFRLTTISETKNGDAKAFIVDTSIFLKSVGSSSVSQSWFEDLLQIDVQSDKYIAQVWTPYNFYLNSIFSHCGVNMFQLYYTGKDWKILNITDTRYKENCN